MPTATTMIQHNLTADKTLVLVLPGDILIGDNDGAWIVPARIAPAVLKETLAHQDWESFSRMQLAKGESLWKY